MAKDHRLESRIKMFVKLAMKPNNAVVGTHEQIQWDDEVDEALSKHMVHSECALAN